MALLFMSGLFLPGCTPKHYRRKADREVSRIVETASLSTPIHLHNYSIDPDRRSRYFDPFDPDREPMPMDDPAGHRYMHCVDCKKLRKCKKCLQTQWAENPFWRQYLNIDQEGKALLDRRSVHDLALLHSPDLQTVYENVYLSALLVSNQRFRFDVHFFGGDSLFYDSYGKLHPEAYDRHSTLTNEAEIGFNKTLATGGEIMASLANSVMWHFDGKDRHYASSLIGLNVVQPLLRGAGKKIVLENLTQSERNLLANVRQMQYYHQAFYLHVLAGYPLDPPSGILYTRTDVDPTTKDASFGSPLTTVGGYYGLMSNQVRIWTQTENIARLQATLQRLQDYYSKGQADNLSVKETQTRLYERQSALLNQKSEYIHAVERYLCDTLGIPPDLPVNVFDPVLEQFTLVSKELNDLQADAFAVLLAFHERDIAVPKNAFERFENGMNRLAREMETTRHDYEAMQKKVGERIEYMKLMNLQINRPFSAGLAIADRIDASLYDSGFFTQSVQDLGRRMDERHRAYQSLQRLFQFTRHCDPGELLVSVREKRLPEEIALAVRELGLEELYDVEELSRHRPGSYKHPSEPTASDDDTAPPDKEIKTEDVYFRNWVRYLVHQMTLLTVETSLNQAMARINSITLVPVDISSESAFDIASANRLDWMNARMRLTDHWRKIALAANALKSDLRLKLEADAGTVDGDGVKFDADNSRISVGLEWDSPLNRHVERSVYRARLIEYQRARREYTRYVDKVKVNINDTLRSLRKSQIDFEIKRANTMVAIMAVDIAQHELIRPIAMVSGRTGHKIDSDLATRLMNALQESLRSQNEFFDLWIRHEALRIGLDLQMGTMQFDADGHWIDPGPVTGAENSRPIP